MPSTFTRHERKPSSHEAATDDSRREVHDRVQRSRTAAGKRPGVKHVALERHEGLAELRPQVTADEALRPGDQDALHLSRRRGREITAGSVLARIEMSSQIDQFSR